MQVFSISIKTPPPTTRVHRSKADKHKHRPAIKPLLTERGVNEAELGAFWPKTAATSLVAALVADGHCYQQLALCSKKILTMENILKPL